MNVNKAKEIFYKSLSNFYSVREINSLYRNIFEFITDKSFELLIIDDNIKIDDKILQNIISRLQNYEPYQYITGKTYFCDLEFIVDKNVLIPRPETEELVELIVKNFYNRKNLKILDIGTGSGCIAVSLAKKLNTEIITAIDYSQSVIETAKKNASLNNANIDFVKHDILSEQNIFDIKYDIIVSNPPYVTNSQKREIHKNVLDFEPHSALFVDDDNALIFYKKIAELSKNILTPKGKLFFEINENYGKETKVLLQENNYKNIKILNDFNNKQRFAVAELK